MKLKKIAVSSPYDFFKSLLELLVIVLCENRSCMILTTPVVGK